jgi:hypothetical protein
VNKRNRLVALLFEVVGAEVPVLHHEMQRGYAVPLRYITEWHLFAYRQQHMREANGAADYFPELSFIV